MSVPPRACFLTAPARRGQWAAALVAATPPRHDEAIKVLEGLFVGAGFSASNAKGCLSLATSLPFPCHSTAFPLRLHCLSLVTPLPFPCPSLPFPCDFTAFPCDFTAIPSDFTAFPCPPTAFPLRLPA